MSRRRFYAPPDAFASDRKSVTLSAEETQHARDALRLQRGDEVYVFDGAGREFRCLVREFARDGAVLDLKEEVEPARSESPMHLTLAVALLKGEKFDLVVQKATELGVSRIIPIITARADVRFKSNDQARRRMIRWQRIALEATKQCGRARLMEIDAPIVFEDLIRRAAQANELRVMFAEREGASFTNAMRDLKAVTEAIALVGSEGGWADDEIGQARASGWRTVTLGGRTLRAETAAIVATTLLQHRFGDLI